MRIASQNRHDVVIVGARVAGAATAMLLARLGARRGGRGPGVIPSDTTSTHLVARSGVVQLRRWGLRDAPKWPGAGAAGATSPSSLS